MADRSQLTAQTGPAVPPDTAAVANVEGVEALRSTPPSGHHQVSYDFGTDHQIAHKILDCGTVLARIGEPELTKRVSTPTNFHHVFAVERGHHRLAWHSKQGVAVTNLRRGNFSVIPAQSEGRLEVNEQARFHYVALPPSRLNAVACSAGLAVPLALGAQLGDHDQVGGSTIGVLFEAAAIKDAVSTYACERALDLLCVHLLRRHCLASSLPKTRGLAAWHLRRVNDFVESRLSHPLSLEDMAIQAGLSRFHFCTAFRHATGMTPNEWLTVKRMDRAAHLLSTSTLSILDIAEAVGFSSGSAFSACFKRSFGITPSAYRSRTEER